MQKVNRAHKKETGIENLPAKRLIQSKIRSNLKIECAWSGNCKRKREMSLAHRCLSRRMRSQAHTRSFSEDETLNEKRQ